jgi:hypothetical protein
VPEPDESYWRCPRSQEGNNKFGFSFDKHLPIADRSRSFAVQCPVSMKHKNKNAMPAPPSVCARIRPACAPVNECRNLAGHRSKSRIPYFLPAALWTLANCQVLCVPCHRAKTAKEDVPRIRKADRARRANNGARNAPKVKIRSRGFPQKAKRESKPQAPDRRPIFLASEHCNDG